MVSKIIKEGLKKAAKGMTKADKKGAQLGTKFSKKSTDKSKASSAMNKIRSGAKVKPENDPRNYPRDASNPFGERHKAMTKAEQLGINGKKSTDKSKAYSSMAKIRSNAKVKPEDDPRNYSRDASNPFGKRDEMEKTGIKAIKKQTTKKAKGGKVGKPKGCGAATRGYGKAMKGKK